MGLTPIRDSVRAGPVYLIKVLLEGGGSFILGAGDNFIAEYITPGSEHIIMRGIEGGGVLDSTLGRSQRNGMVPSIRGGGCFEY